MSRSRSPFRAARRLRRKTLNGRLGIVGGLSILGTTGIVVPYSCSAWIHSIHSGIDVARAAGLTHHRRRDREQAPRRPCSKLYDLPETALIDMGDFVGGMLKYLRRHPVPRVTIAGGVAQDDEARAGPARPALQARRGRSRGARRFARDAAGSARRCSSALSARTPPRRRLTHAAADGVPLGDAVARAAQGTAARVVDGRGIAIEVVLFDRDGALVGRAPFSPAHDPSPARNRRR